MSLTVILLAVGGLAGIGFAYFAFRRSRGVNEKIESAVEAMTASTALGGDGEERRGEGGEPPASFGDAAEYVRALGDLAEKLGKVSPPVAALLISTLPFFFAASLVALYIFSD